MKINQKLYMVLFVVLYTISMGAQTVFRGTVIHAKTKQPILNAKIGVSDQGIGEITDTKGRFNYRRYHKILSDNSELVISAKGYETVTLGADEIRTLFNRSSTIELEPTTKKPKISSVKNITLFWDMSEEMLQRDVDSELAYIQSFVDDYKDVQIRFIAFGYEIQKEEIISVKDGDLSELHKHISTLTYGGPSNYEVLNTEKTDVILFSSNGDANYGTLKVSQHIPVHTLVSIPQKDGGAYLQKLATYTSGTYVLIGKIKNNKGASSQTIKTEDIKNRVTGTVKNLKGFLGDVTISKKGDINEVYSDRKGTFVIEAAIGDVLVLSRIGYFSKEVLVEKKDLGIIELIFKSDELAEIILEGNKRVDNTIETSDGKVNRDKLGYSSKELTTKDFSEGAVNLQQLITGKFPGVSVQGGLYSGSEVTYRIRGGNQSITNDIPPIWVVNGFVYQEPPDFLDVKRIVSISILKSIFATSRYGTIGAGGAFLIKTKNQVYEVKEDTGGNSALVKGNDYIDTSTTPIEEITPSYIVRLQKISSTDDQFKLYKKISSTQKSPLEFYVDVAKHFDQVDKRLADKVREDLAYISRNNTKALRTLAYLYEVAGDMEKATLVYERILQIAPSEAQSYRDLALIYQEKEVGRYNEALELYYNMLGEQVKGVNFEGLEKPLQSELKHLVSLHKDKIDFERLPNEWLTTDLDIDIRMVIDWSDRTVPFEFQFVNPDKKFFKWIHTLNENKDRIDQELSQGFQTEEFIIDDAPKGEWLVNVQYLGDEGDYVLPPFLKYTIYKHYGTSKETKEIKVVKLFKQSNKVTLGKIVL